eukprot:gnl/Hemi2/28842_TR9567_c0_g1_i1.p1 gnl/Hemi2/28842_TR9567_c0_g1~~gnl/Hemi2/28842_TR9567_c0_g1_i1.p1  ORF type:complete len:423 (+),score=116.43 gnl/Hemi2/28842_TR9567_c0_g1_i1:65-1333(+)
MLFRLPIPRLGSRLATFANRDKLQTALALRGLADSVKVLVIDGANKEKGDIDFCSTASASDTLVTADDTLALMFTSGTTGSPKAVKVPVAALASFEMYMRDGLNVQDDDVFWNVADPAWAYGLYYALLGPLLLGQTTTLLNAPFDPARTLAVMQKYRVTNLAGAPTFYRGLRAAFPSSPGLHSLRVASSAGEPLTAGVSAWAKQTLGCDVRDHYGQSELGMVVGQLREGSEREGMGKSLPGFRTVVLNKDEAELPAGEAGQLAVDIANSPLFWFRGYLDDPVRSAQVLSKDKRYYLTGDQATRDPTDNFHFGGRADDVIKSSGYRIEPLEVEQCLMQFRGVLEAAVVGVPDELKGQRVEAFVVLREGIPEKSEALAKEIGLHVKKNLAAHLYPRKVHFIKQLPRTVSGKLQRFTLRDLASRT